MKALIALGWVVLIVEALFIVAMIVSRDVGDDAAGRGVGIAFGAVLGVILLVAAAAFVGGSAVDRARRSTRGWERCSFRRRSC